MRSVEGGWLENDAEGEEVWARWVGDQRAAHCDCVSGSLMRLIQVCLCQLNWMVCMYQVSNRNSQLPIELYTP